MRTVASGMHERFAEIAVRARTAGCGGWAGSRPASCGRGVAGTRGSCRAEVDVDAVGDRSGRVTVSNPTRTRAIASAKVKTDKIDARGARAARRG